jgi:hypothetical protein
MITGNKIVNKRPREALDRLKLAMLGGNFEITHSTEDSISFRHGTYLTQSASLFPKKGRIMVVSRGDGTELTYEIEPVGLPKYWLMVFGVLFCWLIFPPIMAYRALVYHPKRLMENLLQGI